MFALPSVKLTNLYSTWSGVEAKQPRLVSFWHVPIMLLSAGIIHAGVD